jgi:hypothetical protein
MTEICKHCARAVEATVTPGAGPHYARLDCSICGRFLRWLPHPPPPPTSKQLAYLQVLGHDGPAPKSKQQASQLIDELLKAKGQV